MNKKGSKHENPRGRVQMHIPAERRFIYRSDFLLALPAMRAELDRQCQDAGSGQKMLQTYLRPDPLDLHTLGGSSRRRPQKHS